MLKYLPASLGSKIPRNFKSEGGKRFLALDNSLAKCYKISNNFGKEGVCSNILLLQDRNGKFSFIF